MIFACCKRELLKEERLFYKDSKLNLFLHFFQYTPHSVVWYTLFMPIYKIYIIKLASSCFPDLINVLPFLQLYTILMTSIHQPTTCLYSVHPNKSSSMLQNLVFFSASSKSLYSDSFGFSDSSPTNNILLSCIKNRSL